LPHGRFAFGGSDWDRMYVLDEHDRLHEYEAD
jgi:hypothetical protein